MSDTTDNTHFTTKGAKDVVETQSVELGGYADVAPIESSAVDTDLIADPYSRVNMEVFRMSEVLNREFNISTLTWDSTRAAGWIFGYANFPDDLFSIPFLSAKLDGFRNFKGAVRLSVRLASSSFNYGKIMVSYIPNPTEDLYYTQRVSTLMKRSAYPHILLSASESNAGVLDVPFICPNRAIDRKAVNPAASMGRFIFSVLNPLTNINGAAASIAVFVTAQFIDAEIYVPYTPTSNARRVKSKFHAQKEAIQKSSRGIISGVLEETSEFASAMSTTPFGGGFAGLYSYTAGKLAEVARAYGFDKPTSLARTEITKVNPYSDIANARGIDGGAVLAVDPENAISTVPNVGGVSTDECNLRYIAGTPVFLRTISIGLSNAINGSQLLLTNNVEMNYDMYAYFLCELVKWHSGSIKVMLNISAAATHSARFVIYLNTQPTNWAQCYHMVVDIQGDTIVKLTLPYCSNKMAQDETVSSPMYLYIANLSYSQAQTTVDTPIYINVYAAMADDFRLYAPTERVITLNNVAAQAMAAAEDVFQVESNPRLIFQEAFDPIHPSVTGFAHSGFICGEEIRTYRDFIHRYSPIRSLTGTWFSVYEGPGNLGATGFVGLEKLGLIFRYWRGSVRFKLIQSDDYIRAFALRSDTNPATNPYFSGVTFSSSNNPLLEATAPYYSDKLFLSTTENSQLQGKFQSPDAANRGVFMLKAGGDDFSFHFLQPWPEYSYPGQTFYSTVGLMNFIASAPV